MSGKLPSAAATFLGTPALPGACILISQRVDLDLEGRAADEWLLVTEVAAAVVVAPRGKATEWVCRGTHLLKEVRVFRIASEVGCGYLQVDLGGFWTDLVRFSNRLADQFHALIPKLEQLRSNHQFSLGDPIESVTTCRLCGADTDGTTQICRRCHSPGRLLWRAILLMKPYRFRVAFVLGVSLISIAVELVPPWLQREMIDKVLTDGNASADRAGLVSVLITIVMLLALTRTVSAALAILKARMASNIGASLTADLRCRMVAKLQKASLQYYDRNQVGLLMSRVAYDTEAMHAFMHNLTGGFILQMLQMVAIGGMLFCLNTKLALLALLPSPFVVLLAWIFCRYFYAQQSLYWDAVGRQAVALTNLLTGIRVVKSFTQEDRENARFAKISMQLRDQRMSVDLASNVFATLVAFLFAVGGLLVWYAGGRDVLASGMTLGSLMAFVSYLAMFYAPLTTISEGASWISSFIATSERIFDLLDIPEQQEDHSTPTEKNLPVRGQLEFDHVSFSYDGEKTVLEEVSFSIQPGQLIGIVGRSGSGKSTLAGLISRLYEVNSGSVRIDGRDVKTFSAAELRRQVGIVPQDPFLFEGTVAANIAYGDPSAPPEKIIDSAKSAAAHEFIMRLPFGYDTPLGERGSGLSGGERQRVSIARAILYDPRIVILDEATSAIDAESEYLIQCAFERFATGRTILAIAHRMSTLERANRILVLDQGRIIEQGTHSELLHHDGLYATFVRLQRGSNNIESTAESPEPVIEGVDDSAPSRFAVPEFSIRWLRPDSVQIDSGPNQLLTVSLEDRKQIGVSVVRAFPAGHGESYLSLRYLSAAGAEEELGILQTLSEWPTEVQTKIRRALNRRYLLRVIRRIQSLQMRQSLLVCEAETEDGCINFSVPNKPQNIKWFGNNGCLLTDTCNNHFLIPNVNDLSALEQGLLVSPVLTL